MSTPFSHTLRSLEADRYRPSLVGIVFGVLLVVIWGVWFLFAPVPLYTEAETVTVEPSGFVYADFAPDAMQNVDYDRDATVELKHSTSGQSKKLGATITSINQNQVVMVLDDFENTDFPREDLEGVVKIKVATKSPFSLLTQRLSRGGA